MVSSTPRGVLKSDRLVHELLHGIRSGAWSPGERLPSERVLATQFKVSRTAVREALKVLQIAGDIETHSGEGSFVASCERLETSDADAVGAGQAIVYSLERREALELAAGLLAISHATPSDRLRLEAARLDLDEAVQSDDYERYLEVTFDLHEQIARASHNSFIIESTLQVLEAVRQDDWAIEACYDAGVAVYSYEVHRSIVDSVLNRDLVEMAQWVSRHYEEYPSLVRSRVPQEALPERPAEV